MLARFTLLFTFADVGTKKKLGGHEACMVGLSYVAEKGGMGGEWLVLIARCFRKGVWFPFSCCIVKPSTMRCTVTWPLCEY